jgi:hypothetical protein
VPSPSPPLAGCWVTDPVHSSAHFILFLDIPRYGNDVNMNTLFLVSFHFLSEVLSFHRFFLGFSAYSFILFLSYLPLLVCFLCACFSVLFFTALLSLEQNENPALSVLSSGMWIQCMTVWKMSGSTNRNSNKIILQKLQLNEIVSWI